MMPRSLLQTSFSSETPLIASAFNISFTVVLAAWILVLPARASSLAPTTDTTESAKVINPAEKPAHEYAIKTVVIDPGHGGHDPGCLGGHSREKHLALAIGLKFADFLRTAYPHLQVILTRDHDVFIPLYERAAIANRNNADLFVSIHCNFMPGSSATRGTETYVMGLHTAEHNLNVAKRENSAILLEDNYEQNYDYDPNSPEGHIMLSMFQNAFLEQSILFAEAVENKFADHANRKSRGVKQAGFVVLKETTMPSVLVETGFLSNRREEAFLMSADGQRVVAEAMLQAFTDYLQEVSSAAFQPGKVAPQQQAAASPAVAVPATPSAVPVVNKTVQKEQQPNTQAGSFNPYESAVPPSTTPKSVLPEPAVQIEFCVQLAAAQEPQDTQNGKWHDIPYLVEVVQENNLYKYLARNFASLQHAQSAREELQQMGFTDAFLVAYYNGGRISLKEAKSLLGL